MQLTNAKDAKDLYYHDSQNVTAQYHHQEIETVTKHKIL